MPFLPRPEKDNWNPPARCTDPEHNPPGMIVLPPGHHMWQCPRCGHVTNIIVPEKLLDVTDDTPIRHHRAAVSDMPDSSYIM